MFKTRGSGYVINVDDDLLNILLDYYDVEDESDLENVIEVGDYERNDNISDINVSNSNFSWYGYGVWYAKADDSTKTDIANKIREISGINDVDQCWCESFDILLYD